MLNRIAQIANNTRRRGPGYLAAVAGYHGHAARYRLASLSRGLVGARATGRIAPLPPFHFDGQDLERILGEVPAGVKAAIVEEADRYRRHVFRFRSMPEVVFPERVDWEFLPEGNRSWGWDLNRHRFFLTLGTAYFYTRDTAYVEEMISQWQDWMTNNPAGQGPNWRSPFEVAARLRNWMWAYFLLANAMELGTGFLTTAWGGLQQHARYLADHLEYHWPNNHLLLELVTLCEFAVVFWDFGGEAYSGWAMQALEEQVREQVLEDGVHSELCPMYHEIVATELNAFVRLCTRLVRPLQPAIQARISSMQTFSRAMRRWDGSFPLFGDSSYPDTCLRFDRDGREGGDLWYWLAAGKD